MPESLGMLEQGHGHFHDRWRSLHARVRILRSDNGETICAWKTTNQERVAEAVRRMNLEHVVITAVARDDLKDGGADHFARRSLLFARWILQSSSKCSFRIFTHKTGASRRCSTPAPIFTITTWKRFERLTPVVRSRAKYPLSLQVLRRAKELSPERRIVTKSGVMLGLGEKETELFQTMDDLREVGCEVLTMGQYLRPTAKHLPVVEYITPEQFNYYGDIARGKGFLYVASGPLVRSSYHAAGTHGFVHALIASRRTTVPLSSADPVL